MAERAALGRTPRIRSGEMVMPTRHALATSAALSAPAIWRAGELDVRLAATAAEIAEAQALRYAIFYDEMGAEPMQKLYRALGFTEIAAYCDTPIENTVFMSLKL